MKSGPLARFVLVYLLGVVNAGALPVVEISPAQAAPGADVAVRVEASQANLGCHENTYISELRVQIGSVDVGQVFCDSLNATDQGTHWIRFVVPVEPPAPGPQVLTVLKGNERADAQPKASISDDYGRNFEVLPSEAGFIISYKPTSIATTPVASSFDVSAFAKSVINRTTPIPGGATFKQNITNDLTNFRLKPAIILEPYPSPNIRDSFSYPPLPSGNGDDYNFPPRPSPPFRYPYESPTAPRLPGSFLDTIPYETIPGMTRPISPTTPRSPLPNAPMAFYNVARSDINNYTSTVSILNTPRYTLNGLSLRQEQFSPSLSSTLISDSARTAEPKGGNSQICGSYLYKSDGSSETDKIIGFISNRKQKYLNGDVVIAPQTSGVPGGSNAASSSSDKPLENSERLRRTWLGLSSTKVFDSTGKRNPHISQRGKNVRVYIIDTLGLSLSDIRKSVLVDSLKTEPTKVLGATYLTRGHGEIINKLVEDGTYGIAPDVEIMPVAACGSDGSCLTDSIVRGFCDAATYASYNEKRVIVNVSFSTPYKNTLIRMAIQDALNHGVAVVAAYGNNGRCTGKYNKLDYCNAYPADWVDSNMGSIFSVGSMQQGNSAIQFFQRGQILPKINMSSKTTTKPSLYAPGFFWFKDDGFNQHRIYNSSTKEDFEKEQIFKNEWEDGAKAGDVLPYYGTSFSAPLVAGGLALWAEKYPECKTWPDLATLPRRTDQKVNDPPPLDVVELLKLPCPQ